MPNNLPAPLTTGLTDRQVSFVEHYIRLGGRNAAGAAAMAGYSTAGDGHRAIASRLLRQPKVLALIRHLVMTEVQADAVASMDTLRTIRDDISAAADVRRKAANDLLAQAGFLVEKFSTVRHVVEQGGSSPMGNVEKLQQLRTFAESCGMTVTNQHAWDETVRVHGIMDEQDRQRPAIDAEWEEVDPGQDGRVGLEDLL